MNTGQAAATWLSTRVEIGTIAAPMCSRLGFWSWAGGGWSASDGVFEPHTLGEEVQAPQIDYSNPTPP
ncbi:MAG TPA: hypothetical protein VND96_17675 [Candidatus Micrarchaeaceae archaeon]|nr:hypothetical protein [Candidatus Micrarchaeaceae archaeon]